jgi:RHS repeat-associated protein
VKEKTVLHGVSDGTTVTENVQQPLRYMARELDPITGLYYVRNRWYDPVANRFVSEDPIGLEGGINLYAYAANNPVNLRDPMGLTPDCPAGFGLQEHRQVASNGEVTVTKRCRDLKTGELLFTLAPLVFAFDLSRAIFNLMYRGAYNYDPNRRSGTTYFLSFSGGITTGAGGSMSGGVYFNTGGEVGAFRTRTAQAGLDIGVDLHVGKASSTNAMDKVAYGACGGAVMVSGCAGGSGTGTFASFGLAPGLTPASGTVGVGYTELFSWRR